MWASRSGTNAAPVSSAPGQAVLLCQVGPLVCALPLAHVLETMRPLPCEPLLGTAAFVDGVAIIRGAPVPVVDLARLVGSSSDEPRGRLVVVKVGARRVALAVERVLGVRALETAQLTELPPLLGGASADVVRALGLLDARLLVVLETSKLLPEVAWSSPEAAGAQA